MERDKRTLLEGAALVISIVAREEVLSPMRLYSGEEIDINAFIESLQDLLLKRSA